MGGDFVRIFTARYPEEIVGVVLVDSANPDQNEPPSMKSSYNLMPPAEREFLCAAWPTMDRFGFLRLEGFFKPQPSPPQLSSEQRRVCQHFAQPASSLRDGCGRCLCCNKRRGHRASSRQWQSRGRQCRSRGQQSRRPSLDRADGGKILHSA
jgi:hypothetical protein